MHDFSLEHLKMAIQQPAGGGKASPLQHAWDELEAKVRQIYPNDLASLGTYGLDGHGDENSQFTGVEIDDGQISITADVRGHVVIDSEYLSDDLRESLEKLISLLPEAKQAVV